MESLSKEMKFRCGRASIRFSLIRTTTDFTLSCLNHLILSSHLDIIFGNNGQSNNLKMAQLYSLHGLLLCCI